MRGRTSINLACPLSRLTLLSFLVAMALRLSPFARTSAVTIPWQESFSSSLAYYSSSRSFGSLVIVTRELSQLLSYLEDQLPFDSSDCCTQTIWAQAQRLSFSPLVCRLRKSPEVLYLLTWARAWNPNFSPWNISYVPRCFENVFGASTLNRLTELSRSYQNVYVRCSQHPQTTFRFSTLSSALRT